MRRPVAPGPGVGQDLARAFRDHVEAGGHLQDGDALVVGVSGGVDSVVLLHLLRFALGPGPVRMVVAHVDHAMRPESASDADWVRGLSRAWSLPFASVRLAPAPSSEAEARRERYAFLEEVRVREGARWVVTAHHADDQAETVLFRVARGTGLEGLRGIAEVREPAVWRPLLPFDRGQVTAYARAVGLGWLRDPTNASLHYARNVLRNMVIPTLEAEVAPGVRRALPRLAQLARQEEAAWESLLPELLDRVEVAWRGEDRAEGSWEAMRGLHPAVRARVLRTLARRLGRPLDAPSTRRAASFLGDAESGRALSLPGGLVLRRSLDRFVLGAAPPTPEARVLQVSGERGSGIAVVGGTPYEVAWGPDALSGDWTEAFRLDTLRMPLLVRPWAPGDRIRMPYGTKKLKKVFLEARLGADARRTTPVVADADASVVWIPGVLRSAVARPRPGHPVLNLSVSCQN